jgi:hypothetical protein
MKDARAIGIRAWLNFAIATGFAAVLSYTGAIFIPLHETISLTLAFLFGPFFMASSLALFHLLKNYSDTIALRIGVLFNIVGTAMVTLMLVVQQTSFAFHDRFKTEDRGTVSDEQLRWIFREVNAIQLGMDLTWDIFISIGTLCFAVAMWKHPVFGKAISLLGVLLAILLLAFNMAYFPTPPADAGSIDFGPFVASWYTLITCWSLARRKMFLELSVQ